MMRGVGARNAAMFGKTEEVLTIRYGCYLDRSGQEEQKSNYCYIENWLSPVLKGQTLTFRNSFSLAPLGALVCYDKNNNVIDFWTYVAWNARTVTFPVTKEFFSVRFSMPIPDIEKSFLYNNTVGKFLYKGKDAQYNP